MMTAKQYGIVGTILINTLVIFVLLFTYIRLASPTPSEGGILINFGDVESAGGLEEPAFNNQQMNVPEMNETVADAEEGLLTQDIEDAPAVKAPPVPKKKETSTQPPKAKVPETNTPTVNTRALYKSSGQSSTESGTSEGIYKGSGNMGDPSGSSESDNYSKGLGGNGIAFNLNGRNPVHLQKPEFNILKEGSVVVEITVDKTGKVISATPGKSGSTIIDNTLWAAAKKAALESRFNLKEDAPERQIGSITYHFKLQ